MHSVLVIGYPNKMDIYIWFCKLDIIICTCDTYKLTYQISKKMYIHISFCTMLSAVYVTYKLTCQIFKKINSMSHVSMTLKSAIHIVSCSFQKRLHTPDFKLPLLFKCWPSCIYKKRSKKKMLILQTLIFSLEG